MSHWVAYMYQDLWGWSYSRESVDQVGLAKQVPAVVNETLVRWEMLSECELIYSLKGDKNIRNSPVDPCWALRLTGTSTRPCVGKAGGLGCPNGDGVRTITHSGSRFC